MVLNMLSSLQDVLRVEQQLAQARRALAAAEEYSGVLRAGRQAQEHDDGEAGSGGAGRGRAGAGAGSPHTMRLEFLGPLSQKRLAFSIQAL